MNFLIATLLAWNIVSSIPFVENSKVNAIASCGDTLYVGGIPGNKIYRIEPDSDGKLIYDKTSDAVCREKDGVKDIIVNGDYLYVCSRGNGSGLTNDLKRPDFIASFEEGIGFEDSDTDILYGFEPTPCPSRWCKSLHLQKGRGPGHALFSQRVAGSKDSAEFIFWLKVERVSGGKIEIPLIDNNLGVSVDRGKRLGLTVSGQKVKSKFCCGDKWVNLKIVVSDSSVYLDARSEECPDKWERVCSAKMPATPAYDKICLGLKGKGQADIFLDEFAYNAKDIEDCCYINGGLTVLERKSLKVISKFNLDLRCLSMLKDDDYLYMGMIGGLNVYDVSNPEKPVLVGTFRDREREWIYPSIEHTSPYRFKVTGQEFQRMSIMTIPDGRRVIVGGCDTNGIILVDVTRPEEPKLLKHILTTPLFKVEEREKPVRQYIEWGVLCDYPYIYSTVAKLHSLVHTQYYSGKFTSLSPVPDTYGIKVYDIRDINNVKDTLICAPSEFIPTHLAMEGDCSPNQIIRIGDEAFLNFSEKGIARFKLSGFDSCFNGMIPFSGTNRIRVLHSSGDKIIAGDGCIYGPWTQCNIYVLVP